MSSGGGKGGSQTTQVELPSWLNGAARDSVRMGRDAARIGYVPWSGPDVAAFTPQQTAAFGAADAAASAFGLPGGAGAGGAAMPAPTTFAGGVQGFSSLPMFDAAQQHIQDTAPRQYSAIQNMFVRPDGNPIPRNRNGGGGGGLLGGPMIQPRR